MAYNSIHPGPAIDAAVSRLNEIQEIRDESNANLAAVEQTAQQVATNAQAAVQAKNEIEGARTEVLTAQALVDQATTAATEAASTATTKAAQTQADRDAAQLAASQAKQIALGNAIDDEHPDPLMVYSSQRVQEGFNAFGDATDPDKGASLVGFDGITAQEVMDEARPMQSYTALRSYAGRSRGIRLTTPGLAGMFQRDDADTESPDNGGTIIVDSAGRRWKRLYSGPVQVEWFGAPGGTVLDSAPGAQAAHDYITSIGGGSVLYSAKDYRFGTFVRVGSNTKVLGNGIGATTIHHPTSHAFRNAGRDTTGNENITFDGLSFNAGGTFDGAVSCVGMRRAYFRNLDIRGMKPTGVTVGIGIGAAAGNPSHDLVFDGVVIDGPDYCVVLDSSANSYIERASFIGCHLQTSWGTCLSMAKNVSKVTILGGTMLIRGDDPVKGPVGLGVKIWEGSSLATGPRNISISGVAFTGADVRTGIVGVSAANFTNNLSVSNCTFRKLTYAFFNNFAGTGANNIQFTGNLVSDGDYGYYNDNSSDVQPSITSNTFRNLICGIRSSLTRSIVTSNKFENISGKAIHANLAEMAVVSGNQFYQVGQEAFYMAANGASNELCSLTANTFEECGVSVDNTYPVIYLNDQPHIVSDNIMRNAGANKPSWIIGRHANSNNCVINGNWMFGARQGYLQLTHAGDVYQGNKERGGIGLA